MTLGAGAETSVDATMKPSLTDGDTGHHRRRGGRWCNLHRMPKFAAMAASIALAISMACSAFTARDDPDQQVQLPTPDRSQVQIIDPEPSTGLTDPAAVSAYQQGYAHMRAETCALTPVCAPSLELRPHAGRNLVLGDCRLR